MVICEESLLHATEGSELWFDLKVAEINATRNHTAILESTIAEARALLEQVPLDRQRLLLTDFIGHSLVCLGRYEEAIAEVEAASLQHPEWASQLSRLKTVSLNFKAKAGNPTTGSSAETVSGEVAP